MFYRTRIIWYLRLQTTLVVVGEYQMHSSVIVKLGPDSPESFIEFKETEDIHRISEAILRQNFYDATIEKYQRIKR